MKSVRYILALLALSLSPGNARADGGVIRVREAQGPFVVTVFTPSELVMDSPADVSVMVQRVDSSDAILDASVTLILTPPAGSVVEPPESICGPSGVIMLGARSEQFTVPATRRQASNKLLYATPVNFNAVGNWRLDALIECGGESVKIGCDIPVGSPSGRLGGLLPYLLLPPLMVALFAINQSLKPGASVRQDRLALGYPGGPEL